MLAFAFRRAIWAIPTLFGVSLVVFLLTSLLPDPAGELPKNDVAAKLRAEDLRRARFLDLPRFLNVSPVDVRTRIDDCITHMVTEDDEAAVCE